MGKASSSNKLMPIEKKIKRSMMPLKRNFKEDIALTTLASRSM